MPTYIGENKIVDRYLGDKFLEAAYIGDKKVYDPYTEITGNLPVVFNSRAAVALKNYRIYGTSEGAGVATESGEPAGFKIPILMSNNPINLFDSSAVTDGKTIYANGQIVDSAYSYVSDYTKIPLNCSNLFLNWEYETLASSTVRNMVFYNSEKSIIGSYQYQSTVKTREIPLVTGTAYVRFSIDNNASDVTLTTEAPSTSNYDLMIGDSKLYEDEYVDFETQKVYRTIALITHDNKEFITSDNKRFCVRRSNNG